MVIINKTSNPFCKLSISIFTIFLLFQLTHSKHHHKPCPPSSCGKIHTISYPFRLKTDPKNCGDPRYELECNNNSTLLSLFSGIYHVQHIDYINYTIILTDAGVVEDASCSFIPRYFLSYNSFKTAFNPDGFGLDQFDYGPYHFGLEPFTLNIRDNPKRIAYINCTNPVTIDNDVNGPIYVEVDMSNCTEYGRNNGYVYVVLEVPWFYSVRDIKVGCSLKVATLVGMRFYSVWKLKNEYDEIRRGVGKGFEVSWLPIVCENACGKGVDCEGDQKSGQVKCHKHSYCHYAYHTYYDCTKKKVEVGIGKEMIELHFRLNMCG